MSEHHGLARALPGAGLGIAGLDRHLPGGLGRGLPGAGLGIGPSGPIGLGLLLHLSWTNKNQMSKEKC